MTFDYDGFNDAQNKKLINAKMGAHGHVNCITWTHAGKWWIKNLTRISLGGPIGDFSTNLIWCDAKWRNEADMNYSKLYIYGENDASSSEEMFG